MEMASQMRPLVGRRMHANAASSSANLSLMCLLALVSSILMSMFRIDDILID